MTDDRPPGGFCVLTATRTVERQVIQLVNHASITPKPITAGQPITASITRGSFTGQSRSITVALFAQVSQSRARVIEGQSRIPPPWKGGRSHRDGRI